MIMEKVTKRKKSKKGLRKRIGILAIGGLSLVLTVCLSVGATLAWFAGSTWASKSLYMGGPVYVEMAGRGLADSSALPGDGSSRASWKGGDGSLDIEAAASRSTGTVPLTENTGTGVDLNDILLPGQKVQIYSQARVFSTAETNTVADAATPNQSSGANTTNTSNGTATYRTESGRVTTTTTSVLRARFSIEVQFDPGMGFNNFTSNSYMTGYPEQSEADFDDALNASIVWDNSKTDTENAGKRRDGIAPGTTWVDGTGDTDLTNIRNGSRKSIYQWRYCSAAEWVSAGGDLDDGTVETGGMAMGAPFNGTGSDSAIPYYGVWVSAGGNKVESDAFYKARCNTYLGTYKEFYVNEYGNTVTRTVADSVAALEQELNAQFVKLVNDSSDAIHLGYTAGFQVTADGQMKGSSDGATARPTTDQIAASWLYIDPSIGNDTNTDEISTSVGGWWYLVADDKVAVGSSGTGANKIHTAVDSVTVVPNGDNDTANVVKDSLKKTTVAGDETSEFAKGTATLSRVGTEPGTANHSNRLNARLYEIVPDIGLTGDGSVVTINSGTNVVKTVSDAFPFVNGSFALPSDALSNIFANAKITFKVAFQALQAFFPYTTSIDKVDYTDAIMGTAKALNIANAIPIYNEAFDYQEMTGEDVEGL